MASPKSPLTLLVAALRESVALKGFCKTLLLGVDRLAEQRSPPSIVIFPRKGGLSAAMQTTVAVMDADLELVARLWGSDIDNAWDLRERYLQAMLEQALAGGLFFQGVVESWDDRPDTATQGQELEVVLNVHLAASRKVARSRSVVGLTSLERNTVLTEAADAGATQVYVTATLGYPASGILYIEGEKLSYSALSATSFVGLLRGLDGTTAAAHDAGAAVSVTPSP